MKHGQRADALGGDAFSTTSAHEVEQEGVFVDSVLCDRHCTNWHFISMYRGPCRGVPLEGVWGKGREEAQMLAPAMLPQWSVWSSSTPVKRWRSCSCIWYSFSLQLDRLASRILSVRVLLNYVFYICSSWTSPFSLLWCLQCLVSFSCKSYFVCRSYLCNVF